MESKQSNDTIQSIYTIGLYGITGVWGPLIKPYHMRMLTPLLTSLIKIHENTNIKSEYPEFVYINEIEWILVKDENN